MRGVPARGIATLLDPLQDEEHHEPKPPTPLRAGTPSGRAPPTSGVACRLKKTLILEFVSPHFLNQRVPRGRLTEKNEQEKSAQRESFGPDIHIRPKLRSGPPLPGKNKNFRTDTPCGRPRKKLQSEPILRADLLFPSC